MLFTAKINTFNTANFTLKSINYPVMAGGPSRAQFVFFAQSIVVGDFIEIFDSTSTLRFEGYITRISIEKSVGISGIKQECEALCKSFYDYTQQIVTVTDYQGTGEDYAGNGQEFEEWKIREQPNLHVTWPPTGNIPIIFDDTQVAAALPANVVKISQTEENDLPSHVLVVLREWREKRFPCLADFPDVPTTPDLRRNTLQFANHGKVFKIMLPDDPATPFDSAPLYNAEIGGTKFAVIGGAKTDGFVYPQTEHESLSAQINPRVSRNVLIKVGSGEGSGSGSGEGQGGGSGSGGFKNFAKVQMKFYEGDTLPRVFGPHGAGAGKQECYVRARVLESDEGLYVPLLGVNGVDVVANVDHVEVDVSYDITDGTFYRDLTFGGAKGLLDDVADEGEGKWTQDLSGSYLAKEGKHRAQDLLNKAVSHYAAIKLTADATIAGITWNLNGKLTINGNNICLDSISWDFGIQPSENRTRYAGVRLVSGRSSPLEVKKRLINKQEDKNRRSRKNSADAAKPDDKTEDSTDAIKQYARICWLYHEISGYDESEGQIVRKIGDNYELTNILIWVSQADSEGVSFNTGGNDTIFQVELIERDFVIDGVSRNLYRAVACVKDRGKRISHFYTKSKTSKLVGSLASKDPLTPGQTVWDEINDHGEGASANVWVHTTINGFFKINKMIGRVPDDWDLTGTEDYQYMERTGEGVGMPLLFRPIRPLFDSGLVFVSAENFSGSGSIAMYRKKE